jgi:tetrahydromethanopterin S-methyltransferase subunit F
MKDRLEYKAKKYSNRSKRRLCFGIMLDVVMGMCITIYIAFLIICIAKLLGFL